MNVGDICNRLVIDITKDESVRRAAELMRKYHVGTLVVTHFEDAVKAPVGIVTDRDIVMEVVSQGIDPEDITVGDVMSEQPVMAAESDEVHEALDLMCERGVRRMPVVDARGGFTGMLALDDLLQFYTEGMRSLADIVGGQRRREAKKRA